MWWWKKKQQITVLEGELQDSFGRVRQDTNALFQWVDYLYRLNLSHHQTITTLMARNSDLHRIVHELRTHSESHKAMLADLHSKVQSKVQPHEIKAVIDEHYAFDQIHARLRSVEEKLASLHHSTHSSPQVNQLPAPNSQPLTPNPLLQAPSPKLPTSLKDRILRRISRNSKEYIRNVIQSLILKYGRVSAIQLRDMVVEEQGLCSRSSFYRILEEVEQDEGIFTQREGKEKEYFAKIIKTSV